MTNQALIIACSPRKGGNSDCAAATFAAGIESAGGKARILYARDHACQPCIGCNGCMVEKGGRCILPDAAHVENFFFQIASAPLVCFSAPIYFYHFPAGFKALMDRSQPWYFQYEDKKARGETLPTRPSHAMLFAGRPVGAKLFDGALLSLKFFVHSFGLHLTDPLTLRGIDGPRDFAAHTDAEQRVREYGNSAWKALD